MEIIIKAQCFSREALNATAYKFSGDYYISIDYFDKPEEHFKVSLEKKEGDLDPIIEKVFRNELIDQQTRLDVEGRFAHIRNMIVEEAFKPVSK